ncbi:MAG TPA: GAF domain-containing sensor histidine kinase [Methylibium sp.]|nr:GAF domain-containing sensor histidine kinase [Methylibium sp.]
MDDPVDRIGCAPRPESETERLALLHALELLDTPDEPGFDAITRLARQLTGWPIALLGLVDAERTWFKSSVGLDAAALPQAHAFCAQAVAAQELFEVEEARADPRFAHNPLVTGAPQVRACAGVPLRVGGRPLGTLCVLDRVPQRLGMAQREGLRQLAQLAVTLMERRLADRAKGAFIGHMSHEMRTPMNAILGFGQLIALGSTPGTRVALQAEHVVAAGRHLLELIDESLELMRLEAGGLRFELDDVDLVPLLADVGTMLAPLARPRRIELRYRLPSALPVRADARRARQVLLSLAGKAIQHSPEDSTIDVSGGLGEVRPWIAVQDRGPGLDAEQRRRLFKPWLGQERGGASGGGFGLALSQRLIESMGGCIDVHSAPGAGRTFTVTWQGVSAAA